jgi:hypothetical protein
MCNQPKRVHQKRAVDKKIAKLELDTLPLQAGGNTR